MSLTQVTLDSTEFLNKFCEWYNWTEKGDDPLLKLVEVKEDNDVLALIDYYENDTIPAGLNEDKSLTDILEDDCFYDFVDHFDNLDPSAKVYEDNRYTGLNARFTCYETDEEVDLKSLGMSIEEHYQCMFAKGIGMIGVDDVTGHMIPCLLYSHEGLCKRFGGERTASPEEAKMLLKGLIP